MSKIEHAPDCVGALILNAQGQVFMHRRSPSRRLFPGFWDIVGGHVEKGESIPDALAREIAEETGWELRQIETQIGDWHWQHDGLVRREVDYIVTVNGDLTTPQLEQGKHDAHAWIDFDNLGLVMEGRADDDHQLRDIIAKTLEWNGRRRE